MERPFFNKHYRYVGIIATLLLGSMVVMYIIPGTGCTLVREEFLLYWGG